VNSISINADLRQLRYPGERGVPAPNRDVELARFVALAEREMNKKAKNSLRPVWPSGRAKACIQKVQVQGAVIRGSVLSASLAA